MAYESDLALRLTPYKAGEQPTDPDLIKLNTNENPYPPSPRVAEALSGLTDSLRRYPDPEATELRAAIAGANALKPEQVFCGNGSDEVLALCFAAFFAGKNVVAPDVTYSFYPVYANLFGSDLITVPLKEDFTVDVDGMMRGCPIVLANPNAPTGLFLPLKAIRRLAAHCRRNGQVLLVDEAYVAFAPGNAVRLLRAYENLLIVRTFSKSHSLAGMRVGYALGSPKLIDALRRVRDSFNSYPVDRLAQAAATAAVADVTYAFECAARIIAARDDARKRLTDAGIEVLPSAANFLLVRADETDAAPVLTALREEGILVRHFTSPERLRPWLRVTVGAPEDMRRVTDALIKHILKQ